MGRRVPWRRRALLHVVVLLTLLALVSSTHAQAQQETIFTRDDVIAAIDLASAEHGVSWRWLYSIVGCETGWTFDPYSVGKLGELGPVQLYRKGELPRFFARGNTNPFDSYQSIPYLAQRIREGAARAWSCA